MYAFTDYLSGGCLLRGSAGLWDSYKHLGRLAAIFMHFSRVVRLLLLACGFVAPWLFLSPLSGAAPASAIVSHGGPDKSVCDSRVPSRRALARSGFLRRTRVVVRDRLSLRDGRHTRVFEDDDDTAIQTAAAAVGEDHQCGPAALEPAGILQIQDSRPSSHGGGSRRSPRGPPQDTSLI